MNYPVQLVPHVENPLTKAPFTNYDIEALIWDLRGELLETARVFLEQKAGLGLPDWMALKDGADTLASLCVHDSLILAQAHLEPEAPAAMEVA